MEAKGVLITGGGRRIGAAIARAFAAAGWSVAIHCLNSLDEANGLAASLPGGGHCVWQADLDDSASAAKLITNLKSVGFPLECLVNSAALYDRTPLADASPDLMKSIYQVNFFAPFELMRQFRNQFGKGSIVNLLDQRVAITDPAASVYNFSKKSLRDATESCALSWAPEIRVNGIAPGVVLPPPGGSFDKMNKIIGNIPMKSRTTEEEIAKAALWLAESQITGNILYLDGGLHLTSPAESAPAENNLHK